MSRPRKLKASSFFVAITRTQREEEAEAANLRNAKNLIFGAKKKRQKKRSEFGAKVSVFSPISELAKLCMNRFSLSLSLVWKNPLPMSGFDSFQLGSTFNHINFSFKRRRIKGFISLLPPVQPQQVRTEPKQSWPLSLVTLPSAWFSLASPAWYLQLGNCVSSFVTVSQAL